MFKRILLVFSIWRILLFLLAYLATFILPFTPRFPYSEALLIPSLLPPWIWSFANFDGVHYITIATRGYSAQFTQVFFPLYPLLISPIVYLFSDKFAIISGLIISNLAFLLSLYLFTKLILLDYSPKIMFWTLIFLLTFPTSFYFGGLYSESLFFLFIIGSFYAARKKRWWLAGILGALASATRLVGIFLLPALLWEYYHQNKIKNKNLLSFIFYLLSSPILYLVPLGLISYMLYLQLAFGDWLYFWHIQPIFGAERSGTSIILLPQVFFRYLKILLSVPFTIESFFIPLTELLSTTLAIMLLFVAWKKRVRISYIIFSSLAVLVPTLTGTFSSMPRYILIAFPLYIVLGSIKSPFVKIILLTVASLLLGFLLILFTRGTWVA